MRMNRYGLASAFLAVLLLRPTSVWAQTETIEYYALDAVGSVRVVFDASGTILGRMDYGPFGQELTAGTGLPHQRFAGLFRDGEAGLDHAQARSYQVRTGRFSTVDAVFAGLFEPQAWNRYAYALNRPSSVTDADGRLPVIIIPCLSYPCLRFEDSTAVTGRLRKNGRNGGRGSGGNPDDEIADRDDPGAPENPGGGGSVSPGTPLPNPNPSPNPGPNPGPDDCNPTIPDDCAPETGIVQETVNRYKDAWRAGYYDCLVDETVGSATAPVNVKIAEEALMSGVEHTSAPELASGAYHRLIRRDGRFKAWGRSSTVIVPRNAAAIRSVFRADLILSAGLYWILRSFTRFTPV